MALLGKNYSQVHTSHVQHFRSTDHELRDVSAPVIGQIKISRQSVDQEFPHIRSNNSFYTGTQPKTRHSSVEVKRTDAPFRSLSVDRHAIHPVNAVRHQYFSNPSTENFDYVPTIDVKHKNFSKSSMDDFDHVPTNDFNYKYFSKHATDDFDYTPANDVKHKYFSQPSVEDFDASNFDYDVFPTKHHTFNSYQYKAKPRSYDLTISTRDNPVRQSYYRHSPSPLKYDTEYRNIKSHKNNYLQHVPRVTQFQTSKYVVSDDHDVRDLDKYSYKTYTPNDLSKHFINEINPEPTFYRPEMYSPFYSEIPLSRSYSYPHITEFPTKSSVKISKPDFSYKPTKITYKIHHPPSSSFKAQRDEDNNDIEDKIKEIKRRALVSKSSKPYIEADYSNVYIPQTSQPHQISTPDISHYLHKPDYKLPVDKYDLPKDPLAKTYNYDWKFYSDILPRSEASTYENKHPILKEAHNKDLLLEAQKMFGKKHEPYDSFDKVYDRFSLPEKPSSKKSTTSDLGPEFTSPLKPKKVKVNESVRFSCAVSAVPEPKIEWLFNNKIIRTNPRFQASYFYGLCALEIHNVESADAGLYTIKVSNENGSKVSSAPLEVEDSQPAHEFINSGKPSFIQNLEEIVADYGDRIIFKGQVVGRPYPDISWFKDGKHLNESNRVKMYYDKNGNVKLAIKDFQPSDIGTYCCEAENNAGLTRSSAILKPHDHDDKVNKNFEASIDELVKKITDDVEKSFTIPKKDETKSKSSDDIPVKMLENVLKEEPSKNQIKPLCSVPKKNQEFLDNKSDSSEPVVSELTEEQADKSLPFEDKVIQSDIEEATKLDEESKEDTGERPKFVEPIKSQIIQFGEDVRFECIVSGNPKPEIIWLKKDNVLKSNERIKIISDEDKHTLIVSNLTFDDNGEYIVEASNPSGISKYKATLIVKGTAPNFENPLENVSTSVGGEATFECKISGNPKPSVIWSVKGRDINNNDKFIIDNNEDIYTLKVTQTNIDDIGQYTVVATNDFGKASYSAGLDVEEIIEKSKLANESDEKLKNNEAQMNEIIKDTKPEVVKKDQQLKKEENAIEVKIKDDEEIDEVKKNEDKQLKEEMRENDEDKEEKIKGDEKKKRGKKRWRN